jgi:hypothetical protein
MQKTLLATLVTAILTAAAPVHAQQSSPVRPKADSANPGKTAESAKDDDVAGKKDDDQTRKEDRKARREHRKAINHRQRIKH